MRGGRKASVTVISRHSISGGLGGLWQLAGQWYVRHSGPIPLMICAPNHSEK